MQTLLDGHCGRRGRQDWFEGTPSAMAVVASATGKSLHGVPLCQNANRLRTGIRQQTAGRVISQSTSQASPVVASVAHSAHLLCGDPAVPRLHDTTASAGFGASDVRSQLVRSVRPCSP
jgi:hypothetical protein